MRINNVYDRIQFYVHVWCGVSMPLFVVTLLLLLLFPFVEWENFTVKIFNGIFVVVVVERKEHLGHRVTFLRVFKYSLFLFRHLRLWNMFVIYLFFSAVNASGANIYFQINK